LGPPSKRTRLGAYDRVRRPAVDVVEGPDRPLACLGDRLLDGEALAPQVGVEQVPVLDQDNRLALKHGAQGAEAIAHIGRCDGQEADGHDRQDVSEYSLWVTPRWTRSPITTAGSGRTARARPARLAHHTRHQEDDKTKDDVYRSGEDRQRPAMLRQARVAVIQRGEQRPAPDRGRVDLPMGEHRPRLAARQRRKGHGKAPAAAVLGGGPGRRSSSA